MNPFLKYFLDRLNNLTCWLGLIGLMLMLLQLHTALVILFVLLIILPQKDFTELFASWAKGIQDVVKEE